MNFISLSIYGLFSPLKALGMIFSKPKLLKLSLIPLLIGIVMYSILIFLLWYYFPYIMDKFGGRDINGIFAQLWYYIKSGLLIIIIALSIIFTFSLFVNIIASPFNERLAREVLILEGVDKMPTDLKFLKEIGRIMAVETRKSLFLLIITILSFSLSFIAFLSPISFFVTASLLGYAYIDYSLEVMRLPFKTRLRFYMKNFIPVGVIGIIFGFLITLPLVNLFMIPVIVVSGAIFYYKATYRENKEEVKI